LGNTRNNYLKRKYGITEDDYNILLKKQYGVCAICFKPPIKTNLCVDHNHKTGVIRGLLCKRCNYLLGVYHENGILLINAGFYLEEHKNDRESII
jgi:hypothetical protein